MHMVDSLDAGGAEHVAVNLVNALPKDRFRAFLCTTRSDGPLEMLLDNTVGRLRLGRKHRLDVRALLTLIRFIRKQKIRVIHAHSSSIFIAVVAGLVCFRTKIVWHDHFGRYYTEKRPAILYSLFARRLSGVIAVNQVLADWSTKKLHIPKERVWYIPNGVPSADAKTTPALPGRPGSRLVCVANLRPEKDHLSLLSALALVKNRHPEVHLVSVGKVGNIAYYSQIQEEVRRLGLVENITFMGQCSNVPDILNVCDIAVLSSVSEGLPLALLEYGMVGLPVVCTRVGQCSDVLENGRGGVLVSPRSPGELAEGIVTLLESGGLRSQLGRRLKMRVRKYYSLRAMVNQVVQVYNSILSFDNLASDGYEN
jgi:glycosyltransferase involved in cell wall biosynthesis